MKKVAIIRGKFLTKYDMRIFENLSSDFKVVGFSSKTVNQDINFPVVKLPSPMDLPDFPFKMQILNRAFTDAHYLFGLEKNLMGFDIAHTSETYFSYTKQALNAKDLGYVSKVVCSVFENIPFNNEGIRGRKAFKQRAIKNVDHFVAITREAKDALIKEGVSPNRITVIGMGIDTKVFYPIQKKDYSEKRLNILFVGRLEKFKGIFDVLAAFESLTHDPYFKEINLKLSIVGQGSQKSEILKYINEKALSDKVEIASLNYSDLPSKYRESDIFIAPSRKDKFWKEQFGMVFLEAMASALPIVSWVSGSIPDVVSDTALLSKEGDVRELTLNLNKLAKSETLRKKLGKMARERAVNEFDIKKISKKMEEVYRNL